MRFFFELFLLGTHFHDSEGTELTGTDVALAEAKTIVQELRREFPGQCDAQSVLEAHSQDGSWKMSIPILPSTNSTDCAPNADPGRK
jgi:hypothetical protein